MLFYLYNVIYDLTSSLIYNKTSVDEIVPNIWLGNYKAAIDLDFLRKSKINFILNCTPNTPLFNEIYTKDDLYNLQKIETYRIPVDDSLLEKDFILMEKYFKIIIPLLLRKYTLEKRKILIHCHAGKQRSAIVVAALLKVLTDKNYITLPEIQNTNCPKKQFEDIYNYLLEKRPQVFTYGLRINFEPTYRRFFKISQLY